MQLKLGGWLRERGFQKALQSRTRLKMWRGIGLFNRNSLPETGFFAEEDG